MILARVVGLKPARLVLNESETLWRPLRELMDYSSCIVDPAGVGADFTSLEDAIAHARPGAVIRVTAAELNIQGKLIINKGLICPNLSHLPHPKLKTAHK